MKKIKIKSIIRKEDPKAYLIASQSGFLKRIYKELSLPLFKKKPYRPVEYISYDEALILVKSYKFKTVRETKHINMHIRME